MLYLSGNGRVAIPVEAQNVTYTIELERYAGEDITFTSVPFFIGSRFVEFNLPIGALSDGQYKMNLKIGSTLIYSEDLRVNLPRKGIDFIAPSIDFSFVAPTFIGDNWILTSGNWSDLGVWIDTSSWID